MYVDPKRNQQAGNLAWILPYCKPDLPRVAGAFYCSSQTTRWPSPSRCCPVSSWTASSSRPCGRTDPTVRHDARLTIVRVGSRYGCQMWMERFGQNSVYRLVSDEYEKLHELDFTYFNHTRTGDIMSRMTSDTDAIRHA